MAKKENNCRIIYVQILDDSVNYNTDYAFCG